MDPISLQVGELSTNCYIVHNGFECYIVDPGSDGEIIYSTIAKEGLIPKGILLTHGHYDHFGSANELKERFGIKTFLSKNDKTVAENPGSNCSLLLGESTVFIADVYFDQKHTFPLGNKNISVLDTPGHTAGSVCFIYQDMLFSGDTLFYRSRGRTDFPTGNVYEMRESFIKLVNLTGNYKVFPGHGPTTTLFDEIENNQIMKRIKKYETNT